MKALQKEIVLLESLRDLDIANTIMNDGGDVAHAEGVAAHPLDKQFAALNLKELIPRKHCLSHESCLVNLEALLLPREALS